MKYHQDKKMKEQRAKKEESARLRRIASSIAKEVKQFWQSVEKVISIFYIRFHVCIKYWMGISCSERKTVNQHYS